MTIALVRRPSPRLAEGIVIHINRQPVDVSLAYVQWNAYVTALKSQGWVVREIPSLQSAPDSVFIEDTVVMYRDVAIITRPGNDARKPETAAVETMVRDLRCRIERIVGPATLDGGDVLKVGTTVYVGLGGRTNAAGIEQFAMSTPPGSLGTSHLNRPRRFV